MICLNSRARPGHANTERLGCVKNACYALSCFASASDGHALVLRLDDDERNVPDAAPAAASDSPPAQISDRNGTTRPIQNGASNAKDKGISGRAVSEPPKEQLVVEQAPPKSVRFAGEGFRSPAATGPQSKQLQTATMEPLQSPGRSKRVRLFRHLAEELLHIVSSCRDDETVWFAAVYASLSAPRPHSPPSSTVSCRSRNSALLRTHCLFDVDP